MRWKNGQARTRSQNGNKNCETTQLQASSSPHPVEDIFALLLRRDWSQPLAVCKCSEFSARPSLKCCWSSAAILSKVRRLTLFVIRTAGLLFPCTLVYWSSPVSFSHESKESQSCLIFPLPLLFAIHNAALEWANIFPFMASPPFRCQLGHADHLTTNLDHCHKLGFS